MKTIKNFIKKETLLIISFVLAMISAVIVHPDKAYIGYIDFRVLGILLSLMLVVGGFKQAGLFDFIGIKLLSKTQSGRILCLVLVLLCFVMSMLITNDVALITFVPFAIFTLDKCGQQKLILPTVVIQTLAANLGSMMTPIGNPQNLYIYQVSGMGIGEFFGRMQPYTIMAFVLIVLATMLMCRTKEEISVDIEKTSVNRRQVLVYAVFFVLCLMVVLKLISYLYVLAALVVFLLFYDRGLLKSADYSLLFTFVFFFIFTGNLGRISVISEVLERVVNNHEVLVAVLASQFISNVPATLLLSGFTQDFKDLLVGVNLGGLGTLIASMASLISYKQFAEHDSENKGRYFLIFTVMNLIFLWFMAIGFKVIG